MPTVTWDSVNKGSNVTLSNGNLTATTPNYNNTVRATISRNSGKWYWEIKCDSLSNGFIGIVNNTAGVGRTYDNVNAMYYYSLNGNKYNRTASTYGVAYSAGDIISILLDLDNGTIEFWKNGISQGVAFTNVKSLGDVYPAITSGSSTLGGTFTANFGASPFIYNIPKGYYSYDGNQHGIVDKILILSNNVYKKWDTTVSSWVDATSNPPTETDFLNGIDSSVLPSIPKSAWHQLYQLGNSFDVLYYTDDPNKTSANLEITANYSPLDELNDDFEVVTWTDEDRNDIERKINMTALPKGQLIVPVADIKTYGDLNSIVVNKITQTGLSDGIIRLLISFDNGITWKSNDGTNWIVVNKDDINDVINNGLTLDVLSTLTSDDFESQFINEYIKIAYYIEENIRGTDIAQIDSVQFENKIPTETTEVNDMALYILNTKSTINVTFEANHLEGEIVDADSGRVQYRIILNGKPYYPADGSFTPLQPSPVAINIKLQNDEILIGQNNTLRIEFQDYWGHADYWEAQFVGTYAGLMFSDPNGNYYTTDLGQLLKYLDFGVLIAGQTSLENEIVLTNKYGYPVQNLKVKAINIMKDNGIRLELSKTNTPFIAEEELTFDQILNHDEMVKFYVRLATDITATPVSSGVLEIRANAQKA